VIATALIAVVATLLVSTMFAGRFHRLPTVRLQLAGLALFAFAVPLTAVTVGGLVMFHMHEDVTILAVLVASAASALAVALWLGRTIAARISALERVAAQFAAGDLAARAPVEGGRELAALGASFNQMAESIEQIFDARRQLVAWASHDLRTPLAAIQAMLEAIEDGLASPADYLPALVEQAAALSALTDDLFELARIDAGTLTVELRDTSLGRVVTSCVRALQAEATARGVQIEADVGDELPPVQCAEDHVQRVLLNLLTNALRHTPSDGSVVVHAHAVGPEVHVLVEDTGEGLSLEASERMFERFWRGDPSRSRTSGNAGLGLAIARGLVEAQGGRIWAEGAASGGARVSFTLPVAAAP
jgi:signal transduction histidine kinase